jgi:GNAT superfamily N-acetyltransferase
VFIKVRQQVSGMVQRIALDDALLPQALALSGEAGWNQNAADWRIFQRYGEIFGVRIGERLVATAAILPYGTDFAWISMVLVTAEFRRRGLATGLMRQCMDRLRAQRRVALLDATEAGEQVYRALGFVTLTRMTRWGGVGGCTEKTPSPLAGLGREADQGWGEGSVLPAPAAVRTPPSSLNPLRGTGPHTEEESLQELNSSVFGAHREFLLDDFLTRPGAAAWSDNENAVVLRPGRNAWQIGPVIGTPPRATHWLHQAIDATPGPVVIDLLEAGTDLGSHLARRDFTARRGFCRMALGRDTLPGTPERLLAAAGPEFG